MGVMEQQVATRAPLVALLGNPNCGKTALFNRLTGSRQKVANYAGVTIERKEGHFTSPNGRALRVLDLPGAYSLTAQTPDEAITRDVVAGLRNGEQSPDVVVCVVNATNLRLNLRLVLEIQRLGLPMVLALNMVDVAKKRGIEIDTARLSQELGMPVVETVAIQAGGERALVELLDSMDFGAGAGIKPQPLAAIDAVPVEQTQREVRRIVEASASYAHDKGNLSEKIDNVVLHPTIGPVLLAALMFIIFQAVFSWAEAPMDFIESSVGAIGEFVGSVLAEGPLHSLIVDGIIAGVGGVLVFLPQILILFFFILILEDIGYLPRAAFLLDRMMGGVGLSGRAFIPLLSSFACAIPGVMAARTIQNPRDRLVTIMIAPLMTCSARLPVYALIIAAFIPEREVGIFNLQGLVLFALYALGIVSAMGVAWYMKRRSGSGQHPLMMELPAYHWPHLRSLVLGLWERAVIFLMRVGTLILTLTILLWFLSSFPGAPEGATQPPIYYSVAGMLGRALEVIFAPIGFGWQICIALVPGMAAREVAVGALGTVYALSESGDDVAGTLGPLIAGSWSMATALSLLAWYVYAPQCLATLSTVRRETGSAKYAWMMAGYMFGLAYVASFITYRVALALGGG